MEIDLFIFHYLPQQLPFSKLSLSLSPLRVSAACNFTKQQEQWNKIDVFFFFLYFHCFTKLLHYSSDNGYSMLFF